MIAIEEDVLENISQLEPEYVLEIRRLAEDGLNTQEAFDIVLRKFVAVRKLPVMQASTISSQTDQLIDEWKIHRRASFILADLIVSQNYIDIPICKRLLAIFFGSLETLLGTLTELLMVLSPLLLSIFRSRLTCC